MENTQDIQGNRLYLVAENACMAPFKRVYSIVCEEENLKLRNITGMLMLTQNIHRQFARLAELEGL